MGNSNLQPASELTAETKANGDIVLSWKDNSSGESGYRVERSTSPTGSFSKVGNDLPANTTMFTDLASALPTAGAIYYYRVIAFQGSMISAATPVISSTNAVMAVDLGSGDIGVLNYAYALEQLEAAFYTMVVENNFYSGATDNEKRVLEDIYYHEVAHRDFFKAALGTAAIPGLMVDFSSVDFNSRSSVLGTAKVLENTGVGAYNGAGALLENVNYLLVAGKIVSVEARHAAVISNLIDPRSTAFVDTVDAQGLDIILTPAEVLAGAGPFIVTEINAENLPTA
ncbi:hypothetical protein D770_23170 [Flammeovirgaceae bacterium 311]|nr:hypothetical protein D770_23170 [Flammeovirgaceae bacterium 311]